MTMNSLQLQQSYASYNTIFHPYSKKQKQHVSFEDMNHLEGFDTMVDHNEQMTEEQIYEEHFDNNFDVYLDNDQSNEITSSPQYISMLSNPTIENTTKTKSDKPASCSKKHPWSVTTQFYLGSITVVGLFILFRVMQKSK